MGLKVASNGLKSSYPVTPYSLFHSQKRVPVSSLLGLSSGRNPNVPFRLVHRTAPFGFRKSRNGWLKRVCCGSSEMFSSREVSNQTPDITIGTNVSMWGDGDCSDTMDMACAVADVSGHFPNKEAEGIGNRGFSERSACLKMDFLEPSLLGIWPKPPEWPERNKIVSIGIEMKAKSIEIPLSLRMIKRKKQQDLRTIEAREYECSSVEKAFASMVLIIREIQSYAMHMRESLCREDLGKMVNKVHREINSSFVWIFQQVFSQAPTLMVYVMILSAEFGAYSVLHNMSNRSSEVSPETLLLMEDKGQENSNFSSTNGSIRGNGHPDKSPDAEEKPGVVPGEKLRVSPSGNETLNVEEANLWSSIADEAAKMEALLRGGKILDLGGMRKFLSPVYVEIETDDYEEYWRTDLLYQLHLSQDPYNPLLLSNYAHFLCLVYQDYPRAEECFKRAVQVEPPDAESLSRYADFLWMVKKDAWEAEERYQQAITAEPENPYHASRYASFLWSSGGEETCYPLNYSSGN
ncbi:hypothetical protein BT93_G2230 [Corymbia citriodora subsp. variegata]|nr:hypothetical protein BT93_G2230 [Corymbia citriodora subsp. variegata]KAF8022031.1 hypothetical protein BT93_G2230 [Corymbia citriodora subsp. variegata]KAF8022032.1 hypothetical protein BT93_G2230 [Corymbia citriodora subsp. variegata]